MPDGEAGGFHERAPELMAVQHSLRHEVGMDIDQHGVLLRVGCKAVASTSRQILVNTI
ncbi:hypothetical protein D3C85_1334470 [compost metagenome]